MKTKELVPRSMRNYGHFLISKFYTFYYGHPSNDLKVIGVTGTDGKTTTCSLLYEILRNAGYKVAMISTINAYIGDEIISTGFHVTTPSPRMMQSLLKKMVDKGVEYVVLETTSHGLDQHRIGGVHFHAGIYTNITHEHLDYHGTYEAYLAAKAKLIDLISPGGFVVINKDDISSATLISKAKSNRLKTFTYGFADDSYLFATDYHAEVAETRFTLNWDGKSEVIEMRLPGEYNVYNALAAIQVALELGVGIKVIRKGIKNLITLEGRWEVIQSEPFKVIVDFAHTPNALEKVLQYAKSDNKEGRIIVVFGSAGKRDIDKRGLMGQAASKYADITVLTAEDPRGESVININRQIAIGLQDNGKNENVDFYSIEDRAEAVAFAINMAKPKDTVIISGKGHEKSMNLDGINEIPWSDQALAKEILEI